jgi:pimeloyl-ACP methyl ester carboxylesterase
MSKSMERIVKTNGISLNVVEQGQGPLVLLCHGFPECWYSWRQQINALAEAGFHVVAPDMRGYGKSDRPRRSINTRSSTWSAILWGCWTG